MLLFTLQNERQKKQFQHAEGPLELGRMQQQGQGARFLVEDPYTSRDQLRIEELATGEVKIENLGSPITLDDGQQLCQNESRKFTPPLRLAFGRSTLDIGLIPNEDNDRTDANLQTIAKPLAADSKFVRPEAGLGRMPTAEVLGQWFETLLSVQRSAAGSSAFYGETAEAVVDLVGLDRGLVILLQGDHWEVVASHSAAGTHSQKFSMRVLLQVQRERRTFFRTFDDDSIRQSLAGLEAVVASPIFDEEENVVGVLYGSRDMRSASQPRGVEPLEAQFVQLLAGAVSAGLVRLSREAEAARARVQFEQFFSPELARALERDAGILAARERELTLLFADVRGFSRISERIGASATYELLSDILNRLTNQVMDHGGVVIDYYGDGLAAMWNAPTDVSDHAARAIRAATAMLAELPSLNVQWAERLGGIIHMGIGIHTGRAQVGNSGSRRRLKYGPRGHAVNLTSRVEAATKFLSVPCLVTGATYAALGRPRNLRRICRARLTGLAEPVDLYELASEVDDKWLELSERYAAALQKFERDDASGCCADCETVLHDLSSADIPTRWLLTRAERRLADNVGKFDPVFQIETK